LPEHNNQLDAEFLGLASTHSNEKTNTHGLIYGTFLQKFMPLICIIAGIGIYLTYHYIQDYKKTVQFKIIDFRNYIPRTYLFLVNKWYFDAIYNEYVNVPLLKFSYNIIFKLLDKGVLEIIGPYGISYTLFK
jgi:NADH:ubiquinone oxidoreductase subunit 5 (subunit L)/multisubunit Na+/H+ antiporter MnhA subunit